MTTSKGEPALQEGFPHEGTGGKKRMRNQPVLHDEVKQKRTIALTPTAWEILRKNAFIENLSMQEFLERIIRKSDYT